MYTHQSVAPKDKELILVQDHAIAMAQKEFVALQKDSSKQYPSFSWTDTPSKLIDKNFESFTKSSDYPAYLKNLYCRELAIFFGIAFKTEFLGIAHNFEGPLNLHYDNDEKVIDYFFNTSIKKEYMMAFINEEWKLTTIKRGKVNVKYPVIEDSSTNFLSTFTQIFADKHEKEETFKAQRLAFFKKTIRTIVDKDLQEQKMNLAVQEAVFYKLEKYLEKVDTFESLEQIITFTMNSSMKMSTKNE